MLPKTVFKARAFFSHNNTMLSFAVFCKIEEVCLIHTKPMTVEERTTQHKSNVISLARMDFKKTPHFCPFSLDMLKKHNNYMNYIYIKYNIYFEKKQQHFCKRGEHKEKRAKGSLFLWVGGKFALHGKLRNRAFDAV